MNLADWQSPKFNSLPPFCQLENLHIICRYIHIVAIDIPSPAEISAEERACAVLHSLSKVDGTGELACKAIFCEQMEIGKKQSVTQ